MPERLPMPVPSETQVITAMITPMRPCDSPNWEGAQELAEYLVNNGSDGLVLAGTTGESPVLTVKSQIKLFDVVREAVPDAFLIAGTGSNSAAEAVNLTKLATEHESVDALLVVSPYYSRPPQYGIAGYYRRIGAVTDLPIILYNIPIRTGKEVSRDVIATLVDEGVVSGLKDATENTDMAASLYQEFGDALQIYSGNDADNLEYARVGAVGAISVASHWAGPAMKAMFEAYSDGNEEQAEAISSLLAESATFESSHTDSKGIFRDVGNPIPTKVMMGHILGKDVIGSCVSPVEASPEDRRYLEARAPQILEELNRWMPHIKL